MRLKSLREARGWSQQTAAKVAGIRREMWAKYEAGAEPGAKVLTTLALAGWDVTYILVGPRDGVAVESQPRLTPEHRALLDNYDACGPDDRAAVRRTTAALAQSCTVRKKAKG